MARVLMIAYSNYLTDARVRRHAQALAERGDHVDLICLEKPGQGGLDDVNVIGLRIPRYRGASRSHYLRSYLRFFATAALQASRLSLKQRYDVVIVCTMPDAAVLCAIGPKLLGSKVVLDIHDTMPELYRDKFGGKRGAIGARMLGFEERASTWLANRVLAVHDLHRRRLEEAGVRAEKIRVVLNVPDPRIFAPPSRTNSNDGGGDFAIVCHGTVTRRLGLDVAIEAMALLRKRLPDANLVLIGSGDYLAQTKKIAANLNLDGRVRFLAPVPLERLPEVLRGASVGLVPNHASSATHLMLPAKLLEYVALGIPVVSARLRTIRHYFGESAVRFFEAGNAADLARVLEELHANPTRRRELAENAYTVLNSISWEQQRACYYDAIDSLLEGRPGRVPHDACLDLSAAHIPPSSTEKEDPT